MDDLIAEFITETNESIGALDNEIVRLEQNPDDIDLMNNIFRLMHTIKGTCGFLGLGKLEKVAHSGENVLDKLRHKELPVTSQSVSFILQSLDAIKEMLANLEKDGNEGNADNSALIKTLNDFAEGKLNTQQEETKQDDNFNEDDFVPVPAGQTAELAETITATETAKQVAVEEGIKVATKNSGPAAHAATASPTANQSIRVNIDTLENLMQLVSELVLTRNQLLQIMRNSKSGDTDFANPLQRLSHITSDLQEGIMQTRMQPIGNAWNKLPRIIRDLSKELGKKIDLKMVGEDTELDRQLLELIRDPLTHMVRNSADHGVEMPAERLAAGKSETGTIVLSAWHEAGYIIIEIKDDGKGLNLERIRQKAVSNGLITEEKSHEMDPKQIYQYIFAAGFSTAEKVTAVSGRGVGMDVVRTNIEKMGGSIELDSTPGKGSSFQIKIPLTLAIMPVLIFEVAKEKFAIPQINVTELVRVVEGSENKIEKINNTPVLRLRGSLLPLIDLNNVLKTGVTRNLNDKNYVVVCEMGNFSFGVIVDKIFDSEEIVVKPVSSALRGISVYSGSTILGDGSVIMILDPNGLVKTVSENIKGNKNEEEKAVTRELDQPVSFLIFRAGTGAPKAIPLELVSRLEEIDPKNLEKAGDINVIQYRGDLMRITTLDDTYELKNSASTGTQQLIVFNDEDKILGIAVEEILDIVEQPMDLAMNGTKQGQLGSMVIDHHTTDIVDVSHFFTKIFSDWRAKPKPEEMKRYERILLVEDSAFFRKLMVPVLMARGYEVRTAQDAIHALQILEEDQRFNLIISDIDMPKMNGIEFAAKCKTIPSIQDIPIIALTANSDHSLIEEGKQAGMLAHIPKSDREKLFDTVVSILEHKSLEVA